MKPERRLRAIARQIATFAPCCHWGARLPLGRRIAICQTEGAGDPEDPVDPEDPESPEDLD